MLSPLILGERLTPVRVLAAVIGFIGILIVARPSAETINIGTLSAAAAAVGFAGSIIFTKKLTRTETLTCILCWMTATQTVFGLICAGLDGDIALPSRETAPWIVAGRFSAASGDRHRRSAAIPRTHRPLRDPWRARDLRRQLSQPVVANTQIVTPGHGTDATHLLTLRS